MNSATIVDDLIEVSGVGGWLSSDPIVIEDWIVSLRKCNKDYPRPLIEPIQEFKDMVYGDPTLYANFQGMFAQAHQLKKRTPLKWQPEPINFEEFIELLNAIMFTAPRAYQSGAPGDQQASGMIGFPINALLVWPMATDLGYTVFSNALVNQQLKKILAHWSKFLVTKKSRYVLIDGDPCENAIAWLSAQARKEMEKVATCALGKGKIDYGKGRFKDIFVCDPKHKYYGYKSWDDFFTRQFKPNVRPVSAPCNNNVIVNACESTPLAITKGVKRSDKFWLKGQPYSLENMMNWDVLTDKFVGGTVYQAFLSALSYHRWHSPVDGTIVKAYVVNGSYYLESLGQGFFNKERKPDPSAANNSQQFLTAVATRALIFIEADNPDIGLMCVMPVGMAEVSSCDITVKPGQKVSKGDQLGMFHFGGSTHCLFFRKETKLKFKCYEKPGLNAKYNVRVNTELARVKD